MHVCVCQVLILNYIIIIYSILQPDTITETHEAQARIRQWLELDQEGLANLLEVAATRKA